MAKAMRAVSQSARHLSCAVCWVGLAIDPTNDDDQRDRFHYAKHGARPGSDIGQASSVRWSAALGARVPRRSGWLGGQGYRRCLRVTRAARLFRPSRRGHRKERGVPNSRSVTAVRLRRASSQCGHLLELELASRYRTYARSAGWACRLQHQSIFSSRQHGKGAPMRSFIRPGRTYCPS